ncbi:MAG: S8 family serine peptidase [Hyphomicrobiaceae bacterium]
MPVDVSTSNAATGASSLPRKISASAMNHPHATIEILGKDLSQEDIVALQAVAFRVVAVRQFAVLQSSLTRLAAPPDMTAGSALALARKLRPSRQFEPNDLYLAAHARFRVTDSPCGRACKALEMTRWEPQYGRCAVGARIGVIDTAIDESHPALRRSRLQILSTRSEDRAPSKAEHGTGIVSLLVGELGGDFAALVPGASVIAVDAFHSSKTGDSADVFDLIAALDILSAREIDVINMSLSGQDNRFLRTAIERVRNKGIVLVAAAGSEGGSPDVGFPARYANVVAVSAIGETFEPARGGVQGNHIAFAAPGSGISVAMPDSLFGFADGTSFATPFVTAAYAMTLRLLNDREQATRLITSGVRDLGVVGRDNAFGWGLVQYTVMPPC